MIHPALEAALAAAQGRDPELALDSARAARAAMPEDPRPAALMARALIRLGRLDEAERAIDDALSADPNSIPAWVERAALERRRGNLVAATAALEKLIALAPQHVPFRVDLALLAEAKGDLAQAIDAWRNARLLAPGAAAIEFGLGRCLISAGRSEEAVVHLEAALRADPGSLSVLKALSEALLDLGRLHRAIEIVNEATVRSPNSVEIAWLALNTLGAARADEASRLAQARKLANLLGGVEGHLVLATEYRAAWDFPAAAREVEAALTLDPQAPLAHWLRLLIPAQVPFLNPSDEQAFLENFDRGLTTLERYVARVDAATAQRMLDEACAFFLHYSGKPLREELSKLGTIVSELADKAVGDLPKPQCRPPGSKPRIGVCSRNLRLHSVTKLFAEMIRNLDPARFETVLIHPDRTLDDWTASLRAAASSYLGGSGSLVEWARRIVEAQLDVLVFLDVGMDCLTTGLAGLRLAPVQVALWGHPVTTGLPTIDAFLSAELMEPPNAEAHYRERLFLLPGIGAAPSLAAPRPVAPPELGPTDPDTITVFMPQMLKKFGSDFDRILALIAHRAPCIRYLFTPFPYRRPTQTWLRRLDAAFASQGCDLRKHLRFCGWVDRAEWFGLAAASDFALDSFRWSGGVTSLEMLSLDVPVVTLPGPVMRARHTAAMLQLMEIPELIARDEEDYIRIALDLAHSNDFRAEMRSRIRERKHRLFENQVVHAAFAEFLSDAALRAQSGVWP